MLDKDLKYDKGKPPVGMIMEYFPRALLKVASVAGFGAKKYKRGSWQHVPNAFHRYTDAEYRHQLYSSFEELDPESRLPHLAHAAWNSLAVLELYLRERNDDPLRKDKCVPEGYTKNTTNKSLEYKSGVHDILLGKHAELSDD